MVGFITFIINFLIQLDKDYAEILKKKEQAEMECAIEMSLALEVFMFI